MIIKKSPRIQQLLNAGMILLFHASATAQTPEGTDADQANQLVESLASAATNAKKQSNEIIDHIALSITDDQHHDTNSLPLTSLPLREAIVKPLLSTPMISNNQPFHGRSLSQSRPLDELSSPRSPFRRMLTSQSSLGHDTSEEIVDPIVLGNTTITFSTPYLERRARRTAVFWHVLAPVLKESEFWSHAVATGLTTVINFAPADNQDKITAYALQIVLIGSMLHKLSVFADKLSLVREQQALAYAAKNKQNAEYDASHPAINNDNAQNSSIFKSPWLEGFYTCSVVCRNVIWDHVGIFAIFLPLVSSSLLSWSNIAGTNSRTHLVFAATLISIAGMTCLSYAKHIAKETAEMEKKAIDMHVANRQGVEQV